MPIRAVIFDIGGVLLLETPEDLAMKWTRRLGLKDGEFMQLLVASGVIGPANVGAITEEELWGRLGMIYHLDDDQLREFRDDNWAMQEPNMKLIHFLESLRPRYKLATLSNDWPGAREQQNRMFQLEEMLGIEVMLYSCEEGMQKPDTDFYLLACERLGVHPEEVVFIDDREQCVKGAQRVGMKAILFKDTDQTIAEVQACLEASESSETCRIPLKDVLTSRDMQLCPSVDITKSGTDPHLRAKSARFVGHFL
ncbi:haloacid dehalogenase [Ktedonobacter sp. SOSP1-52]|uniref:HAD family hydrolase n=1 Tax=Ktedonobacter sp. SOSP1-52 TaxID=2778366 RepID=UPI0019158620|nr:HAD family phosphatase [Ktedonobacter sp. SOSP1-52]GHO63006.1 haloacid dehalogenase [Ktedonobacter sp. SOSP1-52]